MEQEVLVKVEGLSKKFCKSLKKSLKYGVQDLVGTMVGRKPTDTLRPDEFWALKDINFELRRGECLGLIGHNGAGKSTLLKILNGLINPDEGSVTMNGRVAALIELGAGFNPVMTGRENIYNNGAVLGFSREEVDNKLEAIIDFAELREFIDMPVQNYSSGMRVRLGFAVAAQMEPDVLIIDEVLAVGDLGFVLKCYQRIDYLLPNTAIIFVSHNMPMVSRICSSICLLSKGITDYLGSDVAKGVDMYYSKYLVSDTKTVLTDNTIEITDVQLVGSKNTILWGDDLILHLTFKHSNTSISYILTITIFDKEQRPVASLQKFMIAHDLVKFDEFGIKVKVSNLELSKGIYSIAVTLNNSSTNSPLYRVNNIKSFQVLSDVNVFQPFYLSANYSIV